MKLYTFARTKSEYFGHGDYRDVQSIQRSDDGGCTGSFPPVFLSREAAESFQQRKSNPLLESNPLERWKWESCAVVELTLQRASFVTKVEQMAADFVKAFTAENESEADIQRTLHALIGALDEAQLGSNG